MPRTVIKNQKWFLEAEKEGCSRGRAARMEGHWLDCGAGDSKWIQAEIRYQVVPTRMHVDVVWRAKLAALTPKEGSHKGGLRNGLLTLRRQNAGRWLQSTPKIWPGSWDECGLDSSYTGQRGEVTAGLQLRPLLVELGFWLGSWAIE